MKIKKRIFLILLILLMIVPMTIKAEESENLSVELLKNLYFNNESYISSEVEYTLTLNGNTITNYNHELLTQINFRNTEKGIEFILNNGNKLPGPIEIELNEKYIGKNVYLYNNNKESYELLYKNTKEKIILDEGGRYLITDELLSKINLNKKYVFVALGLLLILVAMYIIVRRRYWFW